MNRDVLGKYVHRKTGTHYIELRAGGECFLFEGAAGITGSYEINGDDITISGEGSTSHGKVQGDTIVDQEGDEWVRIREEAPPHYSTNKTAEAITTEAVKKTERNLGSEPVVANFPGNRPDPILHLLQALPAPEILDILFVVVLAILVVLAMVGQEPQRGSQPSNPTKTGIQTPQP